MRSRSIPLSGLALIRGVPLVLLAAALAGCSTTRTLEIATDPPGAMIWVDQVRQEQGTPVEVTFTHYRYFDVRVEKPGYVPVATKLHVPTEIDGYPLVDLPFELLIRSKRFRRTIKLERLPTRPGSAEARATLDEARGFAERARREAAEGPTGQ